MTTIVTTHNKIYTYEYGNEYFNEKLTVNRKKYRPYYYILIDGVKYLFRMDEIRCNKMSYKDINSPNCVLLNN